MDDELVKLYDLLVREGYYTKTLEEFNQKYKDDPEYKEKVFDVVSRDGFYTKSKEEFFDQYKPKKNFFDSILEQSRSLADASKKKEDAILSESSDGD